MNDVYTIISGTNRPGSNTLKIASHYRRQLQLKGIEPHFLTLEGWKYLEKTPEFVSLEEEMLFPSNKFIFIAPEYNGSIPGVLKLMFDISDYKKAWTGKKALLTGIAIGRSGNVRGMEHLTGILHYLKVVVHPNKLPISGVDKLLNGTGVLHDEGTLQAIDNQIEEFIAF